MFAKGIEGWRKKTNDETDCWCNNFIHQWLIMASAFQNNLFLELSSREAGESMLPNLLITLLLIVSVIDMSANLSPFYPLPLPLMIWQFECTCFNLAQMFATISVYMLIILTGSQYNHYLIRKVEITANSAILYAMRSTPTACGLFN